MPAMFFADKQAAITSIAYLYGEALEAQTAVSFSFTGSHGLSAGNIQPIAGTDWSLVQLFSSKITKQFVDEVNRDEWFAMLLFALVLVASGV